MKPIATFDCECYQNYWLLMLRLLDGRKMFFEMLNDEAIDRVKIGRTLAGLTLVSFNGNNYDIPLISAVLDGATNAKLKRISNLIIVNNMKPWMVARDLGFDLITGLDHIDLIEVAPLTASLKIYGGRMHTRKMQDLPIDPDGYIYPENCVELRQYCENDLALTAELYEQLTPQIALRAEMSVEHGIDLRSKSDAQIAEAVLQKGVGELLNRKIVAPKIPAGRVIKYVPPTNLSFKTESLKTLLSDIRETKFVVGDSGSVDLPAALKGRNIIIGNGVYQLGIGGLHSKEKSVSHYSGNGVRLLDRDVASYYPAIILNNGWYPEQMGRAFLTVYKDIVERRLAAKHAGDKVTADALKITINGSFGKLGNKYSALYSPDLLIQVTITGQLSLLMLIEMLETSGIPVVSANTDGIVIALPEAEHARYLSLINLWEKTTRFETEETEYRSLHCRDVNNYVAVKPDGSYKLKGVFAPASLSKNPTNVIATEAVVRYLVDGTQPEITIAQCDDVRKFVSVRQVKGGAVWRGDYLGKAIRWYYSTECRGETINYRVNNYTVPRTDGAKPLMELPTSVPADVDLSWYAEEAESMLRELGV